MVILPAWRRTLTVLMLVAALLATRAGRAGEARVAVPGEAAQAAARKTINEVFGKQWEAARTAAARQALAASLLEQAGKLADDPAGQFVLLEMARDMAVRGDDPKTALAAANALEATFEVDGLAIKADTVVRLAGSVTDAEQAKMLLEQTLDLVNTAVSREAFAQAQELVTTAAKIAYKARDKALRERIDGYRQWTDELVREHPRYLEAMKKLDADPVDPEANLIAGRFLWFGKGDSEWGIPMLALGTDAELKRLALAELKVTDSIDQRLELADGWWEHAAKETGRAQQQMRWRAAGWYQLVLPKLSGLLKARVEKRLGEVSGPVPPLRLLAVRPRGAPDFGDKKVLLIFGYGARRWTRPRRRATSTIWRTTRLPATTGTRRTTPPITRSCPAPTTWIIGGMKRARNPSRSAVSKPGSTPADTWSY